MPGVCLCLFRVCEYSTALYDLTLSANCGVVIKLLILVENDEHSSAYTYFPSRHTQTRTMNAIITILFSRQRSVCVSAEIHRHTPYHRFMQPPVYSPFFTNTAVAPHSVAPSNITNTTLASDRRYGISAFCTFGCDRCKSSPPCKQASLYCFLWLKYYNSPLLVRMNTVTMLSW